MPILFVAFITVKLFLAIGTMTYSFVLCQFRSFRKTTSAELTLEWTRIEGLMVFDVPFQCKFVGKRSATWVTAISVGIQMAIYVF